jgi:N-acetylneuraminic acid mutarotase
MCTVNGDQYHYNGTTDQWEISDTGTPTPNATTSLAGKVQIASSISSPDQSG